MILHRGYDPWSLANDIALLVLDRPSMIKPVPLAGPRLRLRPCNWRGGCPGGDLLRVVGWGTTEQGFTHNDLK